MTVVPRMRSRPAGRLLAVADAISLVAFTVVGVANHDGGLPPAALARVGLPLLAAWFVSAVAFGTYRAPGVRTLLLAWGVAVPIAAVIRTAVAGGPWGEDFLAFAGVAMVFTLLFLVAGRGLVAASGSVRGTVRDPS